MLLSSQPDAPARDSASLAHASDGNVSNCFFPNINSPNTSQNSRSTLLKPQLISSVQNPRIKFACSLRNAKDRRKTGAFLIDGLALVQIAIACDVQIDQLFVNDESTLTKLPKLIWQQQQAPGTFVCDQPPMEKLQYGGQSHSMIAVAKSWPMDLDCLTRKLRPKSSHPLYLVLDRMEKPGNLGAALRTADASGVDAVLLSDPICDIFNPNAIRSSLGAIFTVPTAFGTCQAVAAWLQQQRCSVFTARVEGAIPYSSASFDGPIAIVIGNEADGLQDRWSQSRFQGVSIPMMGKIDSLNASVSTAILLFEAVRQRNLKPH
ncbi:MAG: TrmH family RNA methyltransferase [Pirellula sp.]